MFHSLPTEVKQLSNFGWNCNQCYTETILFRDDITDIYLIILRAYKTIQFGKGSQTQKVQRRFAHQRGSSLTGDQPLTPGRKALKKGLPRGGS